MLKKLSFLLLFGLILMLSFSIFTYQKVQNILDTKIDDLQVLTINKGSTSKQVAKQLFEQKITNENFYMPFILRFHPEFNKIQAGIFDLKNAKTIKDVLTILNTGKQITLKLSLVEGQTFKDFQATLKNTPYLIYDKDAIDEIIKEKGSLEGWLSPNTFHYLPNSKASDIIKMMINIQENNLQKAWQNRVKNLPLKSPYEMLILASIVEKETALFDEMPQVASVFINRLNAKMKLQTDPTVIYGIGDKFNGNIRKKDLLMPTAYNTYVIDGLPPTPIAMPSKQAIEAVANPAQTKFYYFVATGKGGHKFTTNYRDHQKAVREYLRVLRKKK